MQAKWYAIAAVSMLVFTGASITHYLEASSVVDPAIVGVIGGIIGTIGYAGLYRRQRQNRSVQSLQ